MLSQDFQCNKDNKFKREILKNSSYDIVTRMIELKYSLSTQFQILEYIYLKWLTIKSTPIIDEYPNLNDTENDVLTEELNEILELIRNLNPLFYEYYTKGGNNILKNIVDNNKLLNGISVIESDNVEEPQEPQYEQTQQVQTNTNYDSGSNSGSDSDSSTDSGSHTNSSHTESGLEHIVQQSFNPIRSQIVEIPREQNINSDNIIQPSVNIYSDVNGITWIWNSNYMLWDISPEFAEFGHFMPPIIVENGEIISYLQF
jgi:hypothetical protein